MFRTHLLLVLTVLLAGFACAQEKTGVWDEAFHQTMESADAASGRVPAPLPTPDIIMQVSKHRFGADMCRITAVPADYPAELLRAQVNKMCELLKSPARGLAVGSARVGTDASLTSTTATFATDGIVDTAKGTLRLEPIVKAFAGAPEPHTVDGITILFNGIAATPQMLRKLDTAAIRLDAIANENPPVVEYRIQLLSQDPDALQLPDVAEPEQNRDLTASTQQQNGVDWTLWVTLLLGAVAAGILVYFLMLKASARPGR